MNSRPGERGGDVPRRFSRRAIFLILLAAFVIRLYALESVRFRYDFGYPLGQGMSIVEAVSDGRLADLPTLSMRSGIVVPNPVGASYLWAVVALLANSPYVAVALSAMLSVLAVALVYDLSRRLLGEPAALVAASLAAGASWAVVVARGTWLQGQLEFCAVAVAWLIIPALRDRAPRRLLAGLAAAALVAQGYLVTFGLMAQALVALLLGRAWVPSLRRAALAGLSVCAASVLLYLAPLYIQHVDLTTRFSQGAVGSGAGRATQVSSPAPRIDTSALGYAAQIATGQGFVRSWLPNAKEGGPAAWGWGWGWLVSADDARAAALGVLLALGVVIAAWRSRRRCGERFVLAWFAAPLLAVVVLKTLFLSKSLNYHYLLITSPAAYLLAALPVDWLSKQIHRLRTPHRARAWGRVGLASALAILLVVPAGGLFAYYQYDLDHPGANVLDMLPLRDQLAMSSWWRAHCDDVGAFFYPFEDREMDWRYWTASVYGTVRRVRPDTVTAQDRADAWVVSAGGGTCYAALSGNTPLGNSDAHVQRLNDGTAVTTYRSRPINPSQALRPMRVNLGWTLVDLRYPPFVRAGEWLTVTQVWRIDSLPDEPHALWRFDPFIRVTSPDGATAVTADGLSIPGRAWRAGDFLVSDVRFRVPDQLTPGAYTLSASLYDRVQQKNAVYFDPLRPTQPLLSVQGTLQVN